jgi:hypothetical protein
LRPAAIFAAIGLAATAAYRTARGPTGSRAAARQAAIATHTEARSPHTRHDSWEALAWDVSDDVARIDAIDTLAARGDVGRLPELLAFDPASDPFAAPSVIAAIGNIGRLASPAARRNALERLLSLLASEKERNGQDSAGNVVALVEAIGALGDPSAAPALLRELEDEFHDTAGKTNIVEALARLGARATPAIARLRHRLVEHPAVDPFERELEGELHAALAKLD